MFGITIDEAVSIALGSAAITIYGTIIGVSDIGQFFWVSVFALGSAITNEHKHRRK
jgi:hypothetical protein